jgi:hypothetical protein
MSIEEDYGKELEQKQLENPRIQSYVADKYFVSTAYRESSAPEGGWYYETIVWEWDNVTKKVGTMLFMGSRFKCHFECCEKLLRGMPLEEEDNQ